MQIGKLLRTVVIEPLEIPVEQPPTDPGPEPVMPEPEPEQVPVAP